MISRRTGHSGPDMVSPNSWNNDRLFDLQMKISMTKKKQTKKKAAKSKRNTRNSLAGDANVAHLDARQCPWSFNHRGRAYERTPNCPRWFSHGPIHCCRMKAGSVAHNPTEQK